jgi:putative oxidoreductase
MTCLTPALLLVGRCLLALLFLAGFLQKLADPAAAQALLAARSWPLWLLWPAALWNLLAAVALVTGVLTRPVAAALALYCMVTSLFHFQPEDPWQMSIFVKNWAIAGGCLCLAAQGAGAWRLRRGPEGLG